MRSGQKILVTGSTGMLGMTVCTCLRTLDASIIEHGYRSPSQWNIDLTDMAASEKFLNKVGPAVIVNLVAITDVDLCEKNHHLAYRYNVQTVENIVSWVEKNRSTFLIHISTDHVYDSQGYKNESEICLSNTYALSKYASEIVASKVKSTILRTNFFGNSTHPSKKSISDWAIDNLRNKNEMALFADILFNPILMNTLGEIIKILIQRKICGVYNVGSHSGMSKCDFVLFLAEVLGLSTEHTRRSQSVDFNFKAYRPKDMRMNSQLFEKTFSVRLPSLKDEIKLLGERNK